MLAAAALVETVYILLVGRCVLVILLLNSLKEKNPREVICPFSTPFTSCEEALNTRTKKLDQRK